MTSVCCSLEPDPCDSTWVERMVTQWNMGETVREYSRPKKVLVFNG